MNEILFFEVLRRLREKQLEYAENKEVVNEKSNETPAKKPTCLNYILSPVAL